MIRSNLIPHLPMLLLLTMISASTFAFEAAAEPGQISNHAATDTVKEARRGAQEHVEKIRLERLRNDSRYKRTMALCHNEFKALAQVTYESASEVAAMGSFYAPAWVRFVDNRGIPPEIVALMESEPFQQAIQDCGTGTMTIGKIAASDMVGKVVGVFFMRQMYHLMPAAYTKLGTYGRVGAILQRGMALTIFSHIAYQGIQLGDILLTRTKRKNEAKAIVEKSASAIEQGVMAGENELQKTLRVRLVVLETQLNDPNLSPPLDEETRAAMREQIERIRGVLAM